MGADQRAARAGRQEGGAAAVPHRGAAPAGARGRENLPRDLPRDLLRDLPRDPPRDLPRDLPRP
eukprot:861713-Prymnesium_polylepis.1